jgi:hypothetical protein
MNDSPTSCYSVSVFGQQRYDFNCATRCNGRYIRNVKRVYDIDRALPYKKLVI